MSGKRIIIQYDKILNETENTGRTFCFPVMESYSCLAKRKILGLSEKTYSWCKLIVFKKAFKLNFQSPESL